MKRNKYFNSPVYACSGCNRIMGKEERCPGCKSIAVKFDSTKEFNTYLKFYTMMYFGGKYNGKTIIEVIHHKRFDLHPAIYVSMEKGNDTKPLFSTKREKGFNLLYPSKYYEADIVLIFSDGTQEVIDVKPFSRKKNKFLVLPEAKRKARMMKAVYGIEVIYM